MEKIPLILNLGGAQAYLKVKGQLLLGLASEDRLCHPSPFPYIQALLCHDASGPLMILGLSRWALLEQAVLSAQETLQQPSLCLSSQGLSLLSLKT